MYDPTSGCIREGVPQDISRTLRKRTYLIEKARNANIVGEHPTLPVVPIWTGGALSACAFQCPIPVQEVSSTVPHQEAVLVFTASRQNHRPLVT